MQLDWSRLFKMAQEIMMHARVLVDVFPAHDASIYIYIDNNHVTFEEQQYNLSGSIV